LLGFGAGQLAVLALAGLLGIALRSVRRGEPWISLAASPMTFDRRFVVTMALGPFLLAFLAAAISGLQFRFHWCMSMWCFIGVFSVVYLVPSTDAQGLRRFARAWASVFLLFAFAYASANQGVAYSRRWNPLVATGFPSKHTLRKKPTSPLRGDNAAELLCRRFPTVEWQPPIVLAWHTGANLPPLRIQWGIVYPVSMGAATAVNATARGDARTP
jgi:hypothetical protein